MKMVQLTRWGFDTEDIVSQYGCVPWLVWLGLEKRRIELDKSRAASIRFKGGKAALFVDCVKKGVE